MGPRTVLVEGQTTLAVHTRGVVLAMANQLTSLVGAALTGVTIAFAPEESTRRGDLETVATDVARSEGVTVRHPLIVAQVWGSLSPDYIPGGCDKERTGVPKCSME